MSDSFWIRPIAGGLFILIISVCYSEDFADLCSLCCIIQGKTEDLNCTWRSAQSIALLQSLTNPKYPPRHLTLHPGQKWLLLPRENLTHSHRYQLKVSGGDREEALNFTYSHDGENVFIRPPVLNSSVSEDMTVEVFWENPEDSPYPLLVELRYRILGDSSWTLVNENDLEVNTYLLDDPEPYTEYEFQVRYLPDEQEKNRGSPWSKSYVLTSPEDVPTGTLDVWRSLEKWPLLLIMWKPLSHRSARGKILSYHVVFNGTMSKINETQCCSTILPAQTTHVCVSARNSRGLGSRTCLTPLCSGTSLFAGRTWGDASGKINVWWEEALSPGPPLSYLVEWREEGSKQFNWTRSQMANHTLILPDEFTTGVLYHISVFALKDDECVANFSTETYSLEGAPSAGPNFSIDILTSTEAIISWDELPLQHRRGNVKHYSIYINSTDRNKHLKVYRGNETLSGLSPGIEYTVWMTATTAAGEGPPSTEKTFQTTGSRNRMLSIVSVSLFLLVLMGIPDVLKTLLNFCWPKIPKPGDKIKGLCISADTKVWEHQQDPPNYIITVVEEIEPPPPPPLPPQPPPPPPPQPPPHATSLLLPDKQRPIISGYEKHFLPTPEEVMGLC